MKEKHLDKELISSYLDGVLSSEEAGRVEGHLDACPDCRNILNDFRQVQKLLQDFKVAEPAFDMAAGILQRIQEKKTRLAFKFPAVLAYGLAGAAVCLLVFSFLINREASRTSLTLAQKPTEAIAPRSEKDKVTGHEEFARAKAPAEKAETKGKVSESPARENQPAAAEEAGKEPSGDTRPVGKAEEGKSVLSVSASLEKKVDEKERTMDRSAASAGRALESAPPNIIVREEKQWEDIWQFQNTAQNLSEPLPKVDFKKQMVVAVLSQKGETEYRVIKTEEKDDTVVIQYQEKPGRKREAPLPPYQINIVSNRAQVEFQKVD